MKKKCLDTYALIEITEGNANFSQYLAEEFVITDTTLAEFYSVLLREDGKQTAEYWFRKLTPYSVHVTKIILKEAILFRHKHKKEKISFFDAVGYIYAKTYNYPFVTGDRQFKSKENVEFRQ